MCWCNVETERTAYIRIVAGDPLLGNNRKQTLLHSNESTRNSEGTVANGVFYGGPCRGVISRMKFRWKGAAIQRGLEHGCRGTAVVGAVTRQLLVKAQRAGKDLICAVVNCKVWELAMALYLSVVTRCVKLVNKFSIQSETPLTVTHTWQY
jgi:hypothetical protein